jgi:hypothetical protein
VGRKGERCSDLPELRERVERAASLLESVGNVVRLGQLYCDAAYGALAMDGDRARDARSVLARFAGATRRADRSSLIAAASAA